MADGSQGGWRSFFLVDGNVRRASMGGNDSMNLHRSAAVDVRHAIESAPHVVSRSAVYGVVSSAVGGRSLPSV